MPDLIVAGAGVVCFFIFVCETILLSKSFNCTL